MVARNDRFRSGVPRSAWIAGAVGFALVIAAALVWRFSVRDPDARTQAQIDRDNAAQPKADTRPAASAARKETRGEISGFENRISDRLLADPVAVRPLRGAARIRIHDVVWTDPADGSKFLNADLVTALLDVPAAARADFIVRNVVLVNPDLLVEQPAVTAAWNYERALGPLLEEPSPNAPRRARERISLVDGLTIENGTARVITPENDFTFLTVNGSLSRVAFTGPGLVDPELDVANVSATMLRAGSSVRVPLTIESGRLSLPTYQVAFAIDRARVGQTLLVDVVGLWDRRVPGYGTRATGRAPNVQFAELRPFFASLPEEGTASFAWSIDPLAGGVTRVGVSELNARTGGSRAHGSLVADIPETGTPRLESADLTLDPLDLALVEALAGRKLPYRGTVAGRVTGRGGAIHFDLSSILSSAQVQEPFNIGLVGDATFGANGIMLRGATLNLRGVPLEALRAVMPALPLEGRITGRIALTGAAGSGPLDVDLRLEAGEGVVAMNGTVNIDTPVPTYDLTGRFIGVRLDNVLSPRAPPATLNARFALNGRGSDPAQIDARFSVLGRFTGWETTPDDTVHIRGAIGGGTLTLDATHVQLATMTLTASGQWHYAAPASGGLTYQLAFSSLTPFGPYLPGGVTGSSGSIATAGTLAGSLENPRVEGTIEARDAQVGGYSVEGAEGRFAFALLSELPDLELNLDARGIKTPTAGSFAVATVRARMIAPNIVLDVKADRIGGGAIEVAADGVIDPSGRREATLRRFAVDLGAGQWTLAQPAVFSWRNPPGVHVENFVLQEAAGPGRVAIGGRVLPLNEAAFIVDIVALPLTEVMKIVGRSIPVSGRLSAAGSILGPGNAPTIDLRVQMDSGTVRGVGFTNLTGVIGYVDRRASVTADAVLETGGTFDLKADLPVEVRLDSTPSFKVLATGVLSGVLVADSVPLAAIASVSPMLQEARGVISAHMMLGGTADQPVLGGTGSISNGSVLVPMVNQRYQNINGSVTLVDRRVVVNDLSVSSGGTAVMGGYVEFRELRNPVANLTVTLQDFQALGAERSEAGLTGAVQVSGPISGAVLTGRVVVDNGDIAMPALGRPDILDLDVTDPSFMAAGPALPLGDDAPRPSLYRSLSIDNLAVIAGNDAWFSTETARVQLSGELTVDKRGDSLLLTGTLEGTRGTFTLLAGPIVRRFDIVRANVRFFGTGDLNPSIDVTASRSIVDASGRQIEVLAQVGGTLSRPTLSLATPGGGRAAESELLSVLVFGQPTVGLAGGIQSGTALAGETLAGGVAEYFMGQLENYFGGSLGLDIFQIRPGQGVAGYASPSLVLGRELSEDFFLTVESALAVLFGSSTAQQTGMPVAVRLEWRLSPQYSARFSWEPSNRSRVVNNFTAAAPVAKNEKNQFSVELRRRWTY